MSKTKKIAILAIIAMVLTMLPVSLFAATADSDRLAGADRIGTALEIASAGWSSADTVVLAPADQANLVDSLAAAPLAGQENAPILLTFKGSLDAGVKARIAALGANKVYVIGAISDAVKDEVDAIDGVSVEKLAGADRWATADAINAKLTAPAGTFVVGYNAIPDALSVASFAAANKYAIVLANADGSVDAAKIVGDKTYLVGGTAVVKDYNGATRLGGADRYATNEAVVEGLSFNFDRVYVANGISMVDALAASSLAAKYDAAILLSNGSSVPAGDAVKDKVGMVIALGGPNAVSDAVRDSITGALGNIVNVAVTAANYDDDTADQYVAFTANGKKVTAEQLAAEGWDVEFSAYTSKLGGSNVTGTLFEDVTTGLLVTDLTADTGDYYIQIVLTKGVDIVTSELQKITIKNLNLAASGISGYKLTNDKGGLNEFKQESTTLVVGETAEFTEITAKVGASEEKVTSGFSVKTSNAGVISKDDVVITAETPGTATITLSYGGATKAISFKVVNDAREIDKVRVKDSSDKVITSLKIVTDTTVKVEALDQYGDPYPGGVDDAVSSNTGVATVVYSDPDLAITAVAKGSSTISFYDANGKKIGSLTVTVSDNTDVAKKVFELWKPATNDQAAAVVVGKEKSDFSTDATIDVSDDKYVVYHLKEYNSENISLGASTNVTVDYVESKAGVLNAAPSADATGKIVVEAAKAGTVTLKVTDNDTGKIYTQKITVVDQGYSIKSISFKSIASPQYAKTFNYKSALNVTATGSNPIVNGVTLNKATSHSIRLDLTNGMLYIDKDADGTFGGDDTNLGEFAIELVGDFANDPIANIDNGIAVVAGDDGTIIFKVYNVAKSKVLASTSVAVEL